MEKPIEFECSTEGFKKATGRKKSRNPNGMAKLAIIRSNFLLLIQVSFLEPLNLQQPLSAVPTNSLGAVTVGIGTGVCGLGTGTLQHSLQHPHQLQQQLQQPQLPPPHLPTSISTGASEITANAIAIKTVEQIFDTRRSYKRSTGRSKQRQPRRPSSNCEVKYINENFSSGTYDKVII